jgi:hypothetical protein
MSLRAFVVVCSHNAVRPRKLCLERLIIPKEVLLFLVLFLLDECCLRLVGRIALAATHTLLEELTEPAADGIRWLTGKLT